MYGAEVCTMNVVMKSKLLAIEVDALQRSTGDEMGGTQIKDTKWVEYTTEGINILRTYY